MRERIFEIIAETYETDPSELSGDNTFDESLVGDSLDRVEVMLKLEIAFDISIDEDKFHGLSTLDELVALVESYGPRGAVKVLDHGMVRLIDSMGSDLSIVRNARVSYDAEWRAGEDKGSDTKLIGYLYRNGHNTPFEAVTVTFEIKAPIFVIRQWHRHRTQSYNELSARYRELPQEFYIPELDQITTQSKDNKQMRTDTPHPDAEQFRAIMHNHNTQAFGQYKLMLEMGCPRELARSVLPLGTYSHMFATANLNNWFKFLSERLHEHAQYEIRVYAIEILKMLENIAPIAVAAFKKSNGYN